MRRKRIAVLMAGLTRQYQREYAQGMAEEAAARNVDLCIFNCNGYVDMETIVNEESERRIFSLPDLEQFDGIVSMPFTMPNRETVNYILELLEKYRHIPQVQVEHDTDYAVSIQFDDDTSVHTLMTHMLCDHGQKTFAMVGGPVGNRVADHRLRVAVNTLRKGGGRIRTDQMLVGSWTRGGGYNCGVHLAESGILPDAIICMNDDMALGVIDALRERDICVPEDVRVTGFDAKNEAVGLGITTIRRPVIGAGRLTVRTLVEWADGIIPESLQIVLPTEIKYGNTCGCPMDHGQSNAFISFVTHELRQMDKTMNRASAFSSALFNVHNEQEAGQVIDRYATSWEMAEMHICLTPSFLNPNAPASEDPYAGQMLLLASRSGAKEYSQVCFPTSQLVPILEEEDRRPVALAFNPLYYSNRSFGYVAMDLAFSGSIAITSLISMLDGALMNLAQQRTIQAYAEQVENMSIHDPLTGLINRRGYLRSAQDMLDSAREQQRYFTVLSADLDCMKQINDRHGHQAGDQAICRMANALRILEKEGMVCVHISGDEFISFGITDVPEDADRLHDVLTENMRRLNQTSPWLCDLSVSIGVYSAVPGEEDAPDDFHRLADKLMYQEKHIHHEMLQ